MDVDREPSRAEIRGARHFRSGLYDLALFALFWLSAALGYWPPLYAAVATGLFAFIWTTQFVGYRLVLRYERRDAAAPNASAQPQKWKPGERVTLTYVGISTILMYAVVLSVVWIAVHFGAAPPWLAIATTSFLTLVLFVATAMVWVPFRRIMRERAQEYGHGAS